MARRWVKNGDSWRQPPGQFNFGVPTSRTTSAIASNTNCGSSTWIMCLA